MTKTLAGLVRIFDHPIPMITLESPVQTATTAAGGWEEELFQLELRVARRADELAGRSAANRGQDLLHWFQAEREIFSIPEGCAVDAP